MTVLLVFVSVVLWIGCNYIFGGDFNVSKLQNRLLLDHMIITAQYYTASDVDI